MKKRIAKAPAEEKVLTKKDRIISSLIFGIGFSGFAVPGIYSLTVGSLNAGADLLHIVFMYFLCALGILVITPLFFLFGYFGKRRKVNFNDYGKKVEDSWYQDPARSCMKGNYYHR